MCVFWRENEVSHDMKVCAILLIPSARFFRCSQPHSLSVPPRCLPSPSRTTSASEPHFPSRHHIRTLSHHASLSLRLVPIRSSPAFMGWTLEGLATFHEDAHSMLEYEVVLTTWRLWDAALLQHNTDTAHPLTATHALPHRHMHSLTRGQVMSSRHSRAPLS